jgi:hypothetical protein
MKAPMRSLMVIAVLSLASPAFAADAPPSAPQTDNAKSEAARKDGTRVWDTRRRLLGTPPKPDARKPSADRRMG